MMFEFAPKDTKAVLCQSDVILMIVVILNDMM